MNFKKGFHYVDLESDGAWRLGKNYAFNQERLKDIDFWSGQSLKGKSLLIYGEQGYGDNIQFSRYVPEVANKATKAGGNFHPVGNSSAKNVAICTVKSSTALTATIFRSNKGFEKYMIVFENYLVVEIIFGGRGSLFDKKHLIL